MAANEKIQDEPELMANRPLFSIVIPAYNAEHFILNALDSIANQTFTDYEIILVDDGSQDRTSEQVLTWAEEHPRIYVRLIHQENKGVGAARNSGINSSKGQYIAFLDSDDFWYSNKLEKVINIFTKYPEVDLVCHDVLLQQASKINFRNRSGPYKTYKDLLFKGNCIFTSATIIRREKVLEAGGFSEDLQFDSVEDYDLWLRIARAGGLIEYLNKVLGVIRVHGQGISSKAIQHAENTLNVLESHFVEWNPKTPYYNYLMRRRRGDAFRVAARSFLREREYPMAKRFLLMALKQNPLSWKIWATTFFSMVGLRV